jgi:hypothetical protein
LNMNEAEFACRYTGTVLSQSANCSAALANHQLIFIMPRAIELDKLWHAYSCGFQKCTLICLATRSECTEDDEVQESW